MGGRVLVAAPVLPNPVMDATEIAVSGKDEGQMVLAPGFAHHGEGARRIRGKDGAVEEVWLGGTRFLPQAAVVAELQDRYDKPKKTRRRAAE
jgi:D-alanyl-D-alanine carboxypeptidase